MNINDILDLVAGDTLVLLSVCKKNITGTTNKTQSIIGSFNKNETNLVSYLSDCSGKNGLEYLSLDYLWYFGRICNLETAKAKALRNYSLLPDHDMENLVIKERWKLIYNRLFHEQQRKYVLLRFLSPGFILLHKKQRSIHSGENHIFTLHLQPDSDIALNHIKILIKLYQEHEARLRASYHNIDGEGNKSETP